jgi:formate/nitrite transporter
MTSKDPRGSDAVHPSLDAYTPKQVAERVENAGVAKARASAISVGLLSGLAGAFISLGGMFYLVVTTGSTLGVGPTKLLGGLAFSLGLILVVIAGAELFTGNNLVAMAWASGRVRFSELVRNWVLVYLGNVAGCLGTVALLYLAGTHELADGSLGDRAVAIGLAKSELSLGTAFARGVLCNVLVCLAVWLAMAGRSVTDKILAIVFPITAFVAAGFEHSIANWFFLPYAWLLDGEASMGLAGAAQNLVVVTLGNIFGGTLLVAGVYWVAYLRGSRSTHA